MMNHLIIFLGPELAWLLTFGLTTLCVMRNQPPTELGNQKLELLGYFLPTAGVLLAFVPLVWAPGGRTWWLLRIAIAGAVGLYVVTTRLCEGIDYGDSRNSGVGTAFVLFLMIGFLPLFIGVLAAAFFWRRTSG